MDFQVSYRFLLRRKKGDARFCRVLEPFLPFFGCLLFKGDSGQET